MLTRSHILIPGARPGPTMCPLGTQHGNSAPISRFILSQRSFLITCLTNIHTSSGIQGYSNWVLRWTKRPWRGFKGRKWSSMKKYYRMMTKSLSPIMDRKEARDEWMPLVAESPINRIFPRSAHTFTVSARTCGGRSWKRKKKNGFPMNLGMLSGDDRHGQSRKEQNNTRCLEPTKTPWLF